MRPFLVFLAIISALPAARVSAQGRAGAPWDSVGQVLGSRAAESGGIYRYNFPRTDLMVRVGGVTVEAGLALGSWAGLGTIGPDTVVMGGRSLWQPRWIARWHARAHRDRFRQRRLVRSRWTRRSCSVSSAHEAARLGSWCSSVSISSGRASRCTGTRFRRPSRSAVR